MPVQSDTHVEFGMWNDNFLVQYANIKCVVHPGSFLFKIDCPNSERAQRSSPSTASTKCRPHWEAYNIGHFPWCSSPLRHVTVISLLLKWVNCRLSGAAAFLRSEELSEEHFGLPRSTSRKCRSRDLLGEPTQFELARTPFAECFLIYKSEMCFTIFC